MRLSLHTHASPLPLPQRALPAPAGKPAAGSGADDDSGHGSSIKLQDKAVAERWLVCNALGGGSARELAVKSFRGSGAKMVPWVGVAARLAAADVAEPMPAPAAQLVAAGGGAEEEKQQEAADVNALDGRAFCFLPLPIRTGLPVHLNAYFELSSNRRDIWCAGVKSDVAAGEVAALCVW